MPRRLRRSRFTVYLSLLGLAIVIVVGLAVSFGDRGSDDSLARAVAYRQQGEISASIIELKNALKQDPENVDARLALGRVYLEIGDLVSARKELQRARSYGAGAKAFAEPLSRTWLLQRDYQRVLDELSPADLDPAARAIVLLAHARAYAGLGQLAAARTAVAETLRIEPGNVAALIEKARISIRLDDFATAQEALTALAELAPSNLEAVALDGDLQLRAGNFSAAVTAYRKVAERLPGHLPTKVALANALLAQGIEQDAGRVVASALAQAPGSADANYLNAVIALRNEDYRTALASAELALRANPGHLPSLLIAGAAEFSFGRLESAARNMRQVLARQPDNALATELLTAIEERQARRARERSPAVLIDDSTPAAAVASAADPQLWNRRALAVALDYLDRISRASGTAAEAPVEQAVALLQDGRAAEAFRVLEPKLVVQGTNAGPLAIAGVASLLMGEANQARLLFRSLDDIDGDAAAVQYLLALAYSRLGDQSSYSNRLARSLADDADFLPALAERARLALQEGQLSQAADALRALHKNGMGGAEYQDLQGGLDLLRGEHADAAAAYRRAFSAAPTRLRVLRLAYAETRLGKTAESGAILANWLRDHPSDTAVALALANKRLTSGEYIGAAELYSAVLRQVPDHVAAINNLAWVSLRLGDHAAALQLAQQGLDLAPDDPRMMDTLAEILMTQKRDDEAVPLLRRALQRDRTNRGLQVRLARALANTGQAEDAVDLLRQALDSGADFPARQDAQRLMDELDK